MSSHKKHVEFGLEALEARRMMAGDVDIDLSGSGRLDIEGDHQDNEISITQLVGTNTLRIAGSNGTTVTFDGVTSSVVDIEHQNWNDVKIDLKGGDDAVFMLNVDLNARNGSDLKVDMGSGEDRLLLQDVRFRRNIEVEMGENRQSDFDHVFLNRVEAGRDLRAEMGGGGDQLTMTNATSERRTRLEGENGNDNFDVFNGDTSNLRIELGDGEDRLRIRGTDANFVRIDGGDEVDTLTVENYGFYANTFDAIDVADEIEIFVD